MKRNRELVVNITEPYHGRIIEHVVAENEKEGKRLGYKEKYTFDKNKTVSLKELYQQLIKRFKVLYINQLKDMIKNEDVFISTDSELIDKMLEVSNEIAKDIIREKFAHSEGKGGPS